MAETFSVGEIVIATSIHGRGDAEAMIIEIPLGANMRGRDYALEIPTWGSPPSGVAWVAYAWQLRKKKPPRDDLAVVSWNSVPWWPEELVRNVKEPTHV